MKISILPRFPLLVICLCGSAHGQPKLEPGNWALETRQTVNGKEQPVEKQDLCLDKELQDLAAYFTPALEGVKAECKTTKQPAKGDTMAHRMSCKGQGFTTDIRASVTLVDPRRFTVEMRIETRNRGQ